VERRIEPIPPLSPRSRWEAALRAREERRDRERDDPHEQDTRARRRRLEREAGEDGSGHVDVRA
jgi:hypothetical protein